MSYNLVSQCSRLIKYVCGELFVKLIIYFIKFPSCMICICFYEGFLVNVYNFVLNMTLSKIVQSHCAVFSAAF